MVNNYQDLDIKITEKSLRIQKLTKELKGLKRKMETDNSDLLMVQMDRKNQLVTKLKSENRGLLRKLKLEEMTIQKEEAKNLGKRGYFSLRKKILKSKLPNVLARKEALEETKVFCNNVYAKESLSIWSLENRKELSVVCKKEAEKTFTKDVKRFKTK